MKKTYLIPETECTPVNSEELLQSASASVGGGGNQNGFMAPIHRTDIND